MRTYLFIAVFLAAGLLGCRLQLIDGQLRPVFQRPYDQQASVVLKLSGVVMDGDQPAADAYVALWHGDYAVNASTMTGRDGQYRLSAGTDCAGGSTRIQLKVKYLSKKAVGYPACTTKPQSMDFRL